MKTFPRTAASLEAAASILPLHKPLKRSGFGALLSLVAVLVGAWAAGANAQTTWQQTATGTTYNWNTNGNWSPATFPNAQGATVLWSDTLGAQTVRLQQGITVGSLTFGDSGGTNGAVTIATGTGTNTLTFDVAAGNATLVSQGSANTISTLLSLADSIDVTTTSNLTLSGVISGAGSINKSGAGTLFLNGNNTLTGSISVNAGVLTFNGSNNSAAGVSLGAAQINLNDAGALGSGTLTIGSGATINGGVTLSGNNQQVWNGNFTLSTGTTLNLGSGDVSLGSGAGAVRSISVSGPAVVIGGVIADGATGNAITKTNTGTLTLNGANTFTGGLTVSAGTLNLGNAAAIGAGNLSLTGTLDNTSGSAMTFANSANSITITGPLSFTGSNNLNTGNRSVSIGNADRTITVGANTLQIDGVISATNSSATLTKNGAGRLVLTGSNTFGSIQISAGTLEVNNLQNNGVASSIGNGAVSGALVFNGGTLSYTGSGASINRNFTINTAGGTLASDGTGALVFTNTAAINLPTVNGSRTFTLSGSNTGANSIAGILANNGTGATSINKTGVGQWILAGANTYTGDTTVNAGTLIINGGQTGTGTVSVAAAGAFGGDGSIAGSLSFAAGADFVFSLTNTFTVNGSSVTFGGFSVSDLLGLSSSTADGTYTLINGTASFNLANVSNIGVGNAFNLGAGKSAYFTNGNLLQVTVIPEPSTWALLTTGLVATVLLRRRRSRR